MKLLIIVVIIFSSCSVKPNILKFQDSNEFFLERTLNRINLNLIKPFVSTKDRLIITTIEVSDNSDHSMLKLVEDKLIEKLISMDLNVFERNDNILKKIVSESNSKSYKYLSGMEKSNKTNIPAATKLITYRIEEFGFKIRPHLDNKSLKVREGLVQLQIRVQDATSGELLCSKQISTLFKDDVNEDLIDQFDSFNYTSYTHKYPIIKKDSIASDKFEEIEPEHVGIFDKMKWFTEPQLVFRSGAGTGFGIRYGVDDVYKRLSLQLYYSTSKKNTYTTSFNYDRKFNLPQVLSIKDIKLITRVGAGYSANNVNSVPIGQLGAGLEYDSTGLKFQLGWNHGLPFRDIDELWSTDYVFSIIFTH
jgi:hypothetical protein